MILGKYGSLVLKNLENNYPNRKRELEVTGTLQTKILERENELLEIKEKLEKEIKEKYPQPETKEITTVAKYQQMIDSLVEEKLILEILKKI